MKTLAFIIVFLIVSIIFSCDYKEIRINKGSTVAIIKEKLEVAKSGYAVKYEYTIDNKIYQGSSTIIYHCDFETSLKGKSLPIVYSTKNPEKSILLIRPADFKRWGYEFPDSLNWIKKCN